MPVRRSTTVLPVCGAGGRLWPKAALAATRRLDRYRGKSGHCEVPFVRSRLSTRLFEFNTLAYFVLATGALINATIVPRLIWKDQYELHARAAFWARRTRQSVWRKYMMRDHLRLPTNMVLRHLAGLSPRTAFWRRSYSVLTEGFYWVTVQRSERLPR